MFIHSHKYKIAALWMLGVILLVYPNIGWSQSRVMLPLLIGQNWEQASLRLNAMGLKPARIPPREPCDDPLRINQVINQYPEAGVWLEPGSRVTLVTCAPVIVSLKRQVPDLRGMNLAEAKIALQKLNLRLRYSYDQGCVDPFLQEKVIKQRPMAMSQAQRGAIIWVSICKGTP